MSEYLSWWWVSIGLSAITLSHWLLHNRAMGVSGSWARIVKWREDNAADQSEKPFVNRPKLFMDALMQASIDEFGKDAVEAAIVARRDRRINYLDYAASGRTAVRVPGGAHLLFLLAMVVGAGITTIYTRGAIHFTGDLGTLHRTIFGGGISYYLSLILGGLMIGFGTQLAGGCTSGHGLNGVPRLVPVSMLATTVFLSTAVAVSLLLNP